LIVIRIEEENREQGAVGFEQIRNRLDIFLSPRRIDRTKASVLENQIKPTRHLPRQREKIGEQVRFTRDERMSLRPADRGGREIDAEHTVLRRTERAHIMPRAAAGHQNLARERPARPEELDQCRMRRALFPRRLAAAVGRFPIGLRLFHGCGSLAPSLMSPLFSNLEIL
jgi:hypothetical protein